MRKNNENLFLKTDYFILYHKGFSWENKEEIFKIPKILFFKWKCNKSTFEMDSFKEPAPLWLFWDLMSPSPERSATPPASNAAPFDLTSAHDKRF